MYKVINVRGKLVDLTTPRVMGILNVTPDSFFDGGRYASERDILDRVGEMLSEGADFIDVGAYSSRPGSKDVPLEEELKRATEATRAVVKEYPEAVVSIDTFRSAVAHACVNEGATIVNDISAGQLDPDMLKTVSALDVPYIAMHSRGNPQTMSGLTEYADLLKEVVDYFHRRLLVMRQLGIKDVIIDPGFGFAKTIAQNFILLKNLEYLKILERPILVGLSRKSMIWKTLSHRPDEALNGTTALNTIALVKGAGILRVHDVKAAQEVVKLVATMNG